MKLRPPIADRPIRPERHPGDLDRTLALIAGYIDRDSGQPEWVMFARGVVRHAWRNTNGNEARERAMIEAVWRWIVTNVGYTGDPRDVRGEYREVLADSEALLKMGLGDCDEHVTLAGTLLAAIGIRVRIQVCGPDGVPRHVYLIAFTSAGTPLVVDTTLSDKPFGTVPGEVDWTHWKWEIP